jgi:hypothetical protein
MGSLEAEHGQLSRRSTFYPIKGEIAYHSGPTHKRSITIGVLAPVALPPMTRAHYGVKCRQSLHGRVRWGDPDVARLVHAPHAYYGAQSIQSILPGRSGDLTKLLENLGHLQAGEAQRVRDVFDSVPVLVGHCHYDVDHPHQLTWSGSLRGHAEA